MDIKDFDKDLNYIYNKLLGYITWVNITHDKEKIYEDLNKNLVIYSSLSLDHMFYRVVKSSGIKYLNPYSKSDLLEILYHLISSYCKTASGGRVDGYMTIQYYIKKARGRKRKRY